MNTYKMQPVEDTYTSQITHYNIVGVDAAGKCYWIPQDAANTDYQKYLAWVAEGNTAEEWSPE